MLQLFHKESDSRSISPSTSMIPTVVALATEVAQVSKPQLSCSLHLLQVSTGSAGPQQSGPPSCALLPSQCGDLQRWEVVVYL